VYGGITSRYVVNTSPVSRHGEPAAERSSSCRFRCSRRTATGGRGSGTDAADASFPPPHLGELVRRERRPADGRPGDLVKPVPHVLGDRRRAGERTARLRRADVCHVQRSRRHPAARRAPRASWRAAVRQGDRVRSPAHAARQPA